MTGSELLRICSRCDALTPQESFARAFRARENTSKIANFPPARTCSARGVLMYLFDAICRAQTKVFLRALVSRTPCFVTFFRNGAIFSMLVVTQFVFKHRNISALRCSRGLFRAFLASSTFPFIVYGTRLTSKFWCKARISLDTSKCFALTFSARESTSKFFLRWRLRRSRDFYYALVTEAARKIRCFYVR